MLGRRGHGKLVFLDLVDRSGQIQLSCAADRAGPVDLDLGDIVGAVGRPAKSKRGEPSLAVDELVLLAKTGRPLPDTYHGLVDAETRYRKRYLDLLVNEDARRDFALRSAIVASIRRNLDAAGFIEVETPTPAASLRRRVRRARSSRTRTSSTPTSTCASPPSSTSSG